MILSYLDESGDAGLGSQTRFYVLGAVLVHDHRWNEVLDGLRDLRRFLRDRWGFPPRAELKAAQVRSGGGPFRNLGLSQAERFTLFGQVL